jgi:hypothetical protein
LSLSRASLVDQAFDLLSGGGSELEIEEVKKTFG